jgi:uncharacterized protein (DUF885 family)
MMRYLVLSVCLTLLVAGCSTGPSVDEEFAGLANRYIDAMLGMDPEAATAYGDHRFDHRLTDRSEEAVQARRHLAAAYLDSLTRIKENKLSEGNRIDLAILRNQLESTVFSIDEIGAHRWNPLLHNVGGAIYGLVARDFAPLRERLLALKSRLEAVPAALAVARGILDDPPRVYTETAIIQNRGTISLILDDLQPFLDREPDLRSELVGPRARAIAALEAYGSWLEDELLPRSDGEFRIGRERFEKKLRLTLESDLTLDEIREAAERDLAETRDTMYELALPLYREFYPERAGVADLPAAEVVGEVLDRLADDHPDAESIVAQARGDLADCTAFVAEHDLVTLPNVPVEIIVMPEYQRGFAIAYCDAPGPLAVNEKTFYSISPPPADWTDERKESYFREYNDYMLEDLTIHEAMPGHYLQIAHSNAFAAPTPVRALFASGVFVEGWATYAEQLMAEFGYGGPRVRLQQLKMRLRLLINAIIDQDIHCGDMTEREAMDLMMHTGFQEEGEAAGKWRRAQMSSTQLSTYYVGNLEINRLRALAEERRGDDFSLKEFHDELLSFGSPAPRYVQRLMGL